MQSWLIKLVKVYYAMRGATKSEIMVVWADDSGELEVFHARNFQEVKKWLDNGEAGTLH